MTAKAERITYRQIYFLFASLIWNNIQIALWVGRLIMNGRWQHAFPNGIYTKDYFEGTVAPIICPVIDFVEELGSCRQFVQVHL